MNVSSNLIFVVLNTLFSLAAFEKSLAHSRDFKVCESPLSSGGGQSKVRGGGVGAGGGSLAREVIGLAGKPPISRGQGDAYASLTKGLKFCPALRKLHRGALGPARSGVPGSFIGGTREELGRLHVAVPEAGPKSARTAKTAGVPLSWGVSILLNPALLYHFFTEKWLGNLTPGGKEVGGVPSSAVWALQTETVPHSPTLEAK